MKQSFATRLAVLAAAAVFTVSGSALAQPMHRHGGGAGGDFTLAIAALKGQLNLNTSQQQMWDNAANATRAAHDAGRANFARLHDALATELAKAEPDLAAVAAVGDDVRAKNEALHRQVRDGWLAVYATFSPDQKAIVRDSLKTRIARMEQMRQKHLQARPQG